MAASSINANNRLEVKGLVEGASGYQTPWAPIAKLPMETMNFATIVKKQQEEKLLDKKFPEEKLLEQALLLSVQDEDKQLADDFPVNTDNNIEDCQSDAAIAELLQAQFDREYNDSLKQIEKITNKQSKVTMCLDKFKRTYLNDINDDLDELKEQIDEDELGKELQDWDHFDTNERILDTIPKCGYVIDKEGELLTKHDANLCGVRNACRTMSFPLEFAIGDGVRFNMKLSNKVYNQLKTYSYKGHKKRSQMQDRKDNLATSEFGIDGRTRLILYRLINNQTLDAIHGVISTGKEAIILHAKLDSKIQFAEMSRVKTMPQECAIKVFKTTLNDFKQRDRYIKDDYRFKNRFDVRFSKQNNFVIISMWAEKEMHNLIRMHNAGINCPEVLMLKKHILLMSFIGDNNIPAPKLKNANLNHNEWCQLYDEIVHCLYKLYHEAKLVHADLNEYNILWHKGKYWLIDVAQSVEPQHPNALEFLMRDCKNIINFFSRKGVTNTHTPHELFQYITSLNAENYNAAMLERIHSKGDKIRMESIEDQQMSSIAFKTIDYPFDLAWEESQQKQTNHICQDSGAIDQVANTFNLLNMEC